MVRTMSLDEFLRREEYWGRILFAGPDWVGYAITGRGPSSQVRRLVLSEDVEVVVMPTDLETLKTGNPELLVYPAISVCFPKSIMVASNGNQTKHLDEEGRGAPKGVSAADIITRAYQKHQITYEPDPSSTPRISLVSRMWPMSFHHAFHIVKRAPGSGDKVPSIPQNLEERDIFVNMMATYSGENKDPLPSWKYDGPMLVTFTETDVNKICGALYASLAPKPGHPDFRVAVAVAKMSALDVRIAVVNRHLPRIKATYNY